MKLSKAVLYGIMLLCCSAMTAQDIPTDGLVAYYKFEDDAYILSDQSGNGLDGLIQGDPIWVEGFSGNGLFFDGIDDYVNCGDNLEFDIEFEITLMVWVRPLDIDDSAHSPWIAKGDHAYNLKNGNGPYKIEFDIYDGGWIWLNVIVDETYTDTWHHYAATFNGLDQKMFIDGEMLTSQEHIGTIGITTDEVHLAHNSEASERFFNGTLDEVLIYNVALSDEQIKSIYESYMTGVEANSLLGSTDFALLQNYPNPFNSETTIRYSVTESGPVRLNIYDTAGHLIRTLVNENQSNGVYSVRWNGKAGNGEPVSSGIYFSTLLTGNRHVTFNRMILLK
jgi:hypothetical protein